MYTVHCTLLLWRIRTETKFIKTTTFNFRIKKILKLSSPYLHFSYASFDPLDPQNFGFLDPDPDPRGKISTKNCKKKISLKTQIRTIEKREIIKIFWFLNGSSSFIMKIRNNLDPDPFFSSADTGSESGSASKLIGS